MKIISTILISAAVSVFTAWAVFNYAPLSFFTNVGTPQGTYGATITTINGSDTISGSRTTINTNFSNLNTDLVDIYGTTSNKAITPLQNLSTVGTIVSGTWNGTTLAVANGGTGSTTLAFGQILLGSTTNAIGIVNGFGTAGQFLTSNGSGIAPTWQSASVDQTQNYTWTGVHNFAGTATYIKNLFASTTITLGTGVSTYAITLPSTQGASSTLWKNDGNGNITNEYEAYHILYNSPGLLTSGTTTATVPANSLSTLTNKLRLDFCANSSGGGASASSYVEMGTGSATTTLSFALDNNNCGYIYIVPLSATTQEEIGATTTTLYKLALSFTASSQLYVSFGANPSAGTTNFWYSTVTLISQ